jgi:hypothetical protein
MQFFHDHPRPILTTEQMNDLHRDYITTVTNQEAILNIMQSREYKESYLQFRTWERQYDLPSTTPRHYMVDGELFIDPIVHFARVPYDELLLQDNLVISSLDIEKAYIFKNTFFTLKLLLWARIPVEDQETLADLGFIHHDIGRSIVCPQ